MARHASWFSCAMFGIALVILGSGAGCGNRQKEATEAAINAAQGAIDSVRDQAAAYVPDQLQAAQAALQSARDALAKEDYQSALNAAREAANKARDLATAASAKKDEWAKDWAEMTASVPKSLDAVKKRLDAYSRGAHMPDGLDKDKLADAKTQYEQLKQIWSDAAASATQGNLGDALKKAAGIREPLAKLMELLGIKP